jgi:hypothetical protein
MRVFMIVTLFNVGFHLQDTKSGLKGNPTLPPESKYAIRLYGHIFRKRKQSVRPVQF